MRQFAVTMADETDDNDLDVTEKHLRDAVEPTGLADSVAPRRSWSLTSKPRSRGPPQTRSSGDPLRHCLQLKGTGLGYLLPRPPTGRLAEAAGQRPF